MPLTPISALLTPQLLREHAGAVCVAVSGPTMFDQAATATNESSFIEFRLDSVAQPADAVEHLRAFLASHSKVTAIATCRRKAYGGDFSGTAEQQVSILRDAVRAGCRLVDIEVETAEELGQPAFQELREAGATIIVSWHDFAATPALDPVLERMQPFAPDFYKIVPTATSLRDGLRLIDLLEAHGGKGNLIAMSMGMKGVFTRVLGPRFGSAFTFASANGSGGTAPGQMTVDTLRGLYRIDSITPKTIVYAVAGSPIGGSMSPRMHNTAFASASLDAVYLPLETDDAEELQEVVQRLNVRGLSITMPLKESVLPLLAVRDRSVEQMGACNTLLRRSDGSFTGFNTDVGGIVGPLERSMPLAGKRILVLGAGGAGRAAVFGLCEKGADVYILNRTPERAMELARESGAAIQPRETLAATSFDVIINSTPYGMRGQNYEAPIRPDEMNCRIFFDLVYNPVETPLVREALDRGIRTIPGVAMFVEQGVRQFAIWTDKLAPEGAMLGSVMEALDAQPL